MLKKLLAGIGIVLGLGAVVMLGVFVASESGEVIVLTTYDGDGAPHGTRIWVVDDGGATWVRAGRRSNAWFERLVVRPEVAVVRAGVSRRYRAVPVDAPATRERIHALMAEKYGLADRYIMLVLRERAQSVAVRLDPL